MASIKGHFLNWNFVSNVTEGLTTVKKSNLHRFIVLAIIKEAPLEKKTNYIPHREPDCSPF